MSKLVQGDRIRYRADNAQERLGTVEDVRGSLVKVTLDGDPFPVEVPFGRIERTGDSMADDVKALRKLAKKQQIEGWEEMSIDELTEAVGGTSKEEDVPEEGKPTKPKKASGKKSSKKGKTSKAATAKKSSKKPSSKKASTSKSKASKNGKNPYREGSSLAFIFDELVKGGKVSEIAKRVAKAHPVNVRADVDDVKEHIMSRSQSRTMRVLRNLEAEGYKVTKDGRGADAKVKVNV